MKHNYLINITVTSDARDNYDYNCNFSKEAAVSWILESKSSLSKSEVALKVFSGLKYDDEFLGMSLWSADLGREITAVEMMEIINSGKYEDIVLASNIPGGISRCISEIISIEDKTAELSTDLGMIEWVIRV